MLRTFSKKIPEAWEKYLIKKKLQKQKSPTIIIKQSKTKQNLK